MTIHLSAHKSNRINSIQGLTRVSAVYAIFFFSLLLDVTYLPLGTPFVFLTVPAVIFTLGFYTRDLVPLWFIVLCLIPFDFMRMDIPFFYTLTSLIGYILVRWQYSYLHAQGFSVRWIVYSLYIVAVFFLHWIVSYLSSFQAYSLIYLSISLVFNILQFPIIFWMIFKLERRRSWR